MTYPPAGYPDPNGNQQQPPQDYSLWADPNAAQSVPEAPQHNPYQSPVSHDPGPAMATPGQYSPPTGGQYSPGQPPGVPPMGMGPAGADSVPPKSKAPLITFSVLGVVLVVAAVFTTVLLVNKSNDNPDTDNAAVTESEDSGKDDETPGGDDSGDPSNDGSDEGSEGPSTASGSPTEAAQGFFDAIIGGDVDTALTYVCSDQYDEAQDELTEDSLEDMDVTAEVTGETISGDTAVVEYDLTIEIDGKEETSEGVEMDMVLEESGWKVCPESGGTDA